MPSQIRKKREGSGQGLKIELGKKEWKKNTKQGTPGRRLIHKEIIGP